MRSGRNLLKTDKELRHLPVVDNRSPTVPRGCKRSPQKHPKSCNSQDEWIAVVFPVKRWNIFLELQQAPRTLHKWLDCYTIKTFIKKKRIICFMDCFKKLPRKRSKLLRRWPNDELWTTWEGIIVNQLDLIGWKMSPENCPISKVKLSVCCRRWKSEWSGPTR